MAETFVQETYMAIGIDRVGTEHPKWILHIENKPPIDEFRETISRPLVLGEAADIIKQTSNHWRKVFSIMAKISFALFETNCRTWQEYRDTKLLTVEGFERLDFAPFSQSQQSGAIHLIGGFTYAKQQIDFNQLVVHQECEKLFSLVSSRCLVTPYFDWRQLNNAILEHLLVLMANLLTEVD